jgi:hypothetical protein
MVEASSASVRRSVSFAATPAAIAQELHASLHQPALSLVVAFVSADHDAAAVAAALEAAFAPTPVVGCSTAGEITPEGYREGAVVAFSLGAPDFAAASVLLHDIQDFNIGAGQAAMRQAMQGVLSQAPQATRERMFVFTLIDGLSGCEEGLVSALHAALGDIPLFGGSAGDSLRFRETFVLHDGRAHRNCALVTLVATTLPFRVFKTEHFIAGAEKTVITGADPARRVVTEINAEPAAQEYARVVGLAAEPLTPMIFANHPMVVRVGGANFVRSIQKVNDDGSLTFFCAIDEGIVLTVAEGVDLAEDLARLFGELNAALGPPALVIGFDCILRGLEMDKKRIRDKVGRMMADNNVVGFATYGEQFHAMHVNQTFTGVAIGARGAT